jgi:hypothetical protein
VQAVYKHFAPKFDFSYVDVAQLIKAPCLAPHAAPTLTTETTRQEQPSIRTLNAASESVEYLRQAEHTSTVIQDRSQETSA